MGKFQPLPATNFLQTDHDHVMHRQTVVVAVIFTLIVGVVAALAAHASYRSIQRGTPVWVEVSQMPVIADIRRLVFHNASNTFDPPADGRLNLLVFGIGGEGHDGPQLTDTIILASLDLRAKRIALLSIPRDMAYPLGGGRFEKINALNAYAEQEFPGEGARRTADTFAKLLDIPIHHVLRIDFNGFANFVDALGGLDINVEQSFADPQYPTPDDRWTSIAFKKGPQHFDGEHALIYARSRHGTNGEGSDFARSRRQQLLLLAIREKLLSKDTFSDPRKLAALYAVVSNHIQTDLTLWNMLQLAPLARDFSPERISLRVLTDAPDGELIASMVNGAFMLFPRQPDWSNIREIVKNPFAAKEVAAPKTPAIQSVKIEIKNGTMRTGFAAQVAAKLEKTGYEIVAFGNAVRRNYERSVIVDLTGGKKTAELVTLKRLLQADVTSAVPSPDPTDPRRSLRLLLNDGLPPERLSSGTDFLIILGEASYAALSTSPAYAPPPSP